MSEKKSIVVVDDHSLLVSGLCLLLDGESDMEVVGQADNTTEAIALIKNLQPEVVLLDITIHDTSGLDLLPEIRECAVKTKVIMMTMHEDQQYLEKALANGAHGYVLKKGLDVDLLYAIRSVCRGEVYIQPSMVKTYMAGSEKQKIKNEQTDSHTLLWNALSTREQQVVLGVAHGYTSKEIAQTHFLSEKTISTYRSRAMTKLGFETRSDLVEFIMKLGLL
ncbi:MAG: response regulator transcription factor [Desulfobulbaceae bacterium]|uniref:Response regulator transcription factor n=1 Tax=Candidatus Desulfobia pelagia TaxID=2841692 RepID=A0A8J6NA62_9BACT|nr:response regulator transcription factor [Candidatus Desulfobia pelagia]